MEMKRIGALVALAVVVLVACGGGGEETRSDAAPAAGGGALSAEQLEKGIGPISEVTLGELDEGLAERGEQIFRQKCFACHRMDDRYVGPALRDVVDRRTPEYVMNMMLNPQEMVERHPEARELLAEFMTPMPSQNLTEEDARALLEYLREESAESGSAAVSASP